jgi:hypothetical protein
VNQSTHQAQGTTGEQPSRGSNNEQTTQQQNTDTQNPEMVKHKSSLSPRRRRWVAMKPVNQYFIEDANRELYDLVDLVFDFKKLGLLHRAGLDLAKTITMTISKSYLYKNALNFATDSGKGAELLTKLVNRAKDTGWPNGIFMPPKSRPEERTQLQMRLHASLLIDTSKDLLPSQLYTVLGEECCHDASRLLYDITQDQVLMQDFACRALETLIFRLFPETRTPS